MDYWPTLASSTLIRKAVRPRAAPRPGAALLIFQPAVESRGAAWRTAGAEEAPKRPGNPGPTAERPIVRCRVEGRRRDFQGPDFLPGARGPSLQGAEHRHGRLLPVDARQTADAMRSFSRGRARESALAKKRLSKRGLLKAARLLGEARGAAT
jgi:hypothetical protein